jgi:protein-L-isoaspartate O-methyltransferase
MRTWTDGGDVFDGVADSYETYRPGFPAEVFSDIGEIVGLGPGGRVVEVGPGTGLATARLVELGVHVLAVERGAALARATADRFARTDHVRVVNTRFEDWSGPDERFDAVVSANAWHWLEAPGRWTRAHGLLRPHGWLVLVNHVVVREPGQPEVYEQTAHLHERHASDHPGWGVPATPAEFIAAADAAASSIAALERVIARAPDLSSASDGLFDAPIVRWYRQTQHFDAHGFVGLLRTTSLYGSLPDHVREPLLDGIETHIRTRMDDHALRDYLIAARLARRTDPCAPGVGA